MNTSEKALHLGKKNVSFYCSADCSGCVPLYLRTTVHYKLWCKWNNRSFNENNCNNMREHVRPFSFERVAFSDTGKIPSYIRISKSKIPGAGRGLFAIRSLPTGTPLTEYPGPVINESNVSSRTRSGKRKSKRVHAYAFEIACTPNVLTLQPDPFDLSKGVAHIANDAIHPEVTGFSNNCEFIQKKKGETEEVYLCTSRKVKRGEELFVDYLMPYWINGKHPHSAMSKWLKKARRIQHTMKAMGVRLEQYMGGDEYEIVDPDLRVFCGECEPTNKRVIKCCPSESMYTCSECKNCIFYM